MSAPISFGQLLLDAHRDCANRPAKVLDEALTERVRAWADGEMSALSTAEIEPAKPFEVEQ